MKARIVKAMSAVLLLGAVLLAAGCMKAPVVPPWGTFYTKVVAPLDLDANGGKAIGPKSGTASSVAILGLVAWGDAGIYAAAENGCITRVNHVDYEFKNIFFGFYAKYTTIAYGE